MAAVQSAYGHLPLSFEANQALKLADRNYREALKMLEPEDKEHFNALHYRLGRVCEETGDKAAAIQHYEEVAAIDYGFGDVAQRLDALTRDDDAGSSN